VVGKVRGVQETKAKGHAKKGGNDSSTLIGENIALNPDSAVKVTTGGGEKGGGGKVH